MTEPAFMPPPILVLMGLRVSGKTTLGKRVAKDLSRPFVDLDDRVAEAAGVSHAADLINTRGLEAFRELEAGCLIAALGEHGVVLSLGGGTPTAPGAAEVLTAARDDAGVLLVYLHARPETLAARLRVIGTATRPSLTGEDPADEMARIYAERHPLYERLASTVIDADEWDEDALAAKVAALCTP
jgi:shikimate kinase